MSFNIFDDEEEIALVPAPRLAHELNLGIDWTDRTIHLTDEIDTDTGSWIWQLLERWAGEPVSIHMTTPGGDVDSMFQIHDAIRRHGAVTVTSYGQCCSAGVLILACAHSRLVSECLVWMSHESTAASGELGYRASKDRRKVDDWMHVYWAELMGRYTPRDADWWKRKTERQAEYWLLGGQSVVDAGCADRVI